MFINECSVFAECSLIFYFYITNIAGDTCSVGLKFLLFFFFFLLSIHNLEMNDFSDLVVCNFSYFCSVPYPSELNVFVIYSGMKSG